jgi:CheY-like chemotaxis protein
MGDVMRTAGPVEILLVEDNAGDARLTREALKSGQVWNHLNVVRDGVEALSYLRREGEFSGAARPDLILLRSQSPEKRWPGGAGRDQGRRGPEADSEV